MGKLEYYELLSRAELSLHDISIALDFNIDGLLEQTYKDGQQAILKQLKNFVTNGHLAEHYLDAVIKESE